jgi:site-specific recombinase XerD
MKLKINDNAFFWDTAMKFIAYYLSDIRQLSENTIKTYKNCLNCYINYLEEEKHIIRKNINFSLFNRKQLMQYMSWMSNIKKLAPRTCNLRLTAIHSLLEYSSNECVELMPIYIESGTIRNIKLIQKPIEFLEKEAMSALLNAPNNHKKSDRRNRMMLILLYDTGARTSELLNLCLGDLHLKSNPPYITLFGKGKVYRNIPLMVKTQEHLNYYLREFHSIASSNSPLFYAVTRGEKHKLSSDTLEKMIKKYVKKASIECLSMPEKVYCHMIRKTRAMHLYQEGIPLTHIQQLLGHKDISTTAGFYAFATLETLRKSLEKANPEEGVRMWKNENIIKTLYKL